MRYFCTYFDHNYLNKGLALYDSLDDFCGDFRLYILCLSHQAYDVLSKMQLNKAVLIRIENLESNDKELYAVKSSRSQIEYYFTCTSCLISYVFNQYPEVDLISYVDSDLCFYSSPEPIFDEMGSNSILIIGHRFPDGLRHLEMYGVYNVGFLSFRRDEPGRACLDWWRKSCLEWCYDRLENDRYADQKYLDNWPSQFKNVVVLQHKGAGLSPWNVSNYIISLKNDKILVDGQEVIFYHFHGLKKKNKWIYDTNLSIYRTRTTKLFKDVLYRPYILKLDNNTSKVLRVNPNITSVSLRSPAQRFSIGYPLSLMMVSVSYISKVLYGDFIFNKIEV